MSKKIYTTIPLVTIVSILVGCSSGGGDTVIQGRFMESGVQGVHYQTPSRSGTTAENGEYNYVNGEAVTFSIGDTLLGSTSAKAVVSPFDLTGAEPVTGNAAIRLSLNNDEPYNRAHNIGLLLATLDDDNDLSNGIVISDNVAAQFNGTVISFDEAYYKFRYQTEFAALLAQLNGDSVFSTSRQVARSWTVMKHLYDDLGIQNAVFAKTKTSSDTDADQQIDNISISNFDDLQQLASTEYDADNDTIIDRYQYFSYNDYGDRLSKTVDSDGNGTINERYDYEYNQYGRRTKETRDTDNNGAADYIITVSYDGRGNVTREEKDTNADTTPDITEVYEYNPQDLVTLKQVDGDSNTSADGQFDYRQLTSYDDQGRRILLEVDNDNDGSIDSKITYIITNLPGGGYESAANRDSNNDGNVTSIETFIYNQHNKLIYKATDSNADGSDDGNIVMYTYDAAGNQLEATKDSDADSVIDEISSWFAGNFNNVDRYESDNNADGQVDEIYYYEYQLAGGWWDMFN